MRRDFHDRGRGHDQTTTTATIRPVNIGRAIPDQEINAALFFCIFELFTDEWVSWVMMVVATVADMKNTADATTVATTTTTATTTPIHR